MGKCVIFCAGEFDTLRAPVTDCFLIAADGGLAHTQKLGLRPDLVLGDFDSLGYVPAGAVVHPVEKDDTDAMLAIRAGLAAGCRDFVIYGALEGPRLDHALASLQSLQFLAQQGAKAVLAGTKNTVLAVKDATVVFPADMTGIVSVFCMGEPATGVSIRGLKYEMENGELAAGFPLGVSNRFMGKESRIAVKNGCVLVFLDVANGMRWRYE